MSEQTNNEHCCNDCKNFMSYYTLNKGGFKKNHYGNCLNKRGPKFINEDSKACKNWESNLEVIKQQQDSTEKMLRNACKDINKCLKVIEYYYNNKK